MPGDRAVDPLPDPDTEPTVPLERSNRLLGIGRSLGYQLAKEGAYPVPVIRAGGIYRVPTAPLLRALGREVA